MKSPKRRAVSKCVLVVGAVALLGFLFGGYALDDLHLAPFFGFRTEWSKLAKHRVKVDVRRYQCDTVDYEVEAGGAGGIGVTVTLMRDGKRLLEVGGDETTFIGFRDVDGDGLKEVLVTSASPWPEKGVWKATSVQFTKVDENLKAAAILTLAKCLMHAKFGVLSSVLLIAWGVAGIRDNRKAAQSVDAPSQHGA